MDDRNFSAWNKELLEASRSDGLVDFAAARRAFEQGEGEEPVLDAGLFWALYSGEAEGGEATAKPPRYPRWRIRGATFATHVDLSDSCHVLKSALPPLAFEDCTFRFGLCADDTTMRRLSFKGCALGAFCDGFGRVVSLSLRNTHIEGDLAMRSLSSSRDDQVLTISAFGVHVNGMLEISDTACRAAPDERQRLEERATYAVDLYGAEIGANLRLFPRTRIDGGLSLRAARIAGDVHLCGLQVSDGLAPEARRALAQRGITPRSAIDGTSSRIGANVFFLSAPDLELFAATGPVTLWGMEVTGSVQLGAAQFRADKEDGALLWSGGKIGGSLFASPELREGSLSKWRVAGGVSMAALEVKSSVGVVGTVSSLDARRLTVCGDTTLALQVGMTDQDMASEPAELNLGGADLKGSLELAGLSFPSPADPDAATRYVFSMRDADVGHTLSLAARSAEAALQLLECRRSVLRCYPGCHLFRIKTDDGIASVLSRPGRGPILLDGGSHYLHDLSRRGALDLSTPEAVRDYIRFFGAYVWGDEGAFAIVEDASQLPAGSVKTRSCGRC